MATRVPLTTLDIARAIADAVLAADTKGHGRERNSMRDRPTRAVFSALERAGVWFMRVGDDGDGASQPQRALGEQAGVCRWCGCTDTTPCDDGLEACRWVNRAHTLCSACAGIERLIHTTRGRADLLTAWAAVTERIAQRTGSKRRTGGTRRLRKAVSWKVED